MDNLNLDELRSVPICGTMWANNRRYWLVSPTPITGDFDIIEGTLRFTVIPVTPAYGTTNPANGKSVYYYNHARHLIVPDTAYSIEYETRNPVWVIDNDKLLERLQREDNNA